MKSARWMFVAVALILGSGAMGQKFDENMRLPEAAPGETIVIPVTGLTATAPVRAVLVDEGGKGRPVTASKVDDKGATITLPTDLRPARYRVRVDSPKWSDYARGELPVKPIQPKITSIAPEETAYSPSLRNSRFEFRVVGEGFVPGQTAVVSKYGEMLAPALPDCANQKVACVEHDRDDPTRVLHVRHFPRYRTYTGELFIAVRVGNVQSADSLRLVLSWIPRGWIFATALVIFLLIALIVSRTVKAIRSRYGLLPAFVLDKETNTYSLSKLQLLLWAAAGVFGYIYLFICRLLVQWKPDFPDVPEGFPLLLGISGGATVVATAVQANRGAKGSGSVHPSWADFISSGGVVAAERFQFFVWTIVGILGFFGLLLTADPASFSELPKIPDQFLGLMGISALAYLGGKAVRNPGPVVRMVTLNDKTSDFELVIDGVNLEKDAKVRLDRAADPFTPKNVASVSQGDTAHPNWSTQLIVTIDKTSNEGKILATGTQAHTIEVINADGHSGSGMFGANPPTITQAAALTAQPQEQTLAITGTNFVDGMKAEWIAPSETAAVAIKVVKLVSSTQVTVDVTAKKKGTGKIVLIPPIGAPVSADVTVN